MITLQPRFKKSEDQLKATYYSREDRGDLNINEIYEKIKLGETLDVDFSVYRGKYEDCVKANEHFLLLNLIEGLTRYEDGLNTKKFSRIFRGGGFIKYIRDLENRVIKEIINESP